MPLRAQNQMFYCKGLSGGSPIQNFVTQIVFERATERCTDFQTIIWLKEKNPSLELTENALIIASKRKDDFLRKLLNRSQWKLEETSVTSRVLDSTVENTMYTDNLAKLLKHNPNLSFTPASLMALVNRWASFYVKDWRTPRLLHFLQAREDFKVSKEEVLLEAMEDGNDDEFLEWCKQASEVHMRWRWEWI
jgi:ferric iron reductase protein FhuF